MNRARRPGQGRAKPATAVPRELGDLPFARILRPHDGELVAAEDYDGYHFAGRTIRDAAAESATFTECAVSNVTVDGGQYRKCRCRDVWLRDVRLLSPDLAETDWMDSWLVGCAAAGVPVFGSSLRRVVFHGSKLDSVNFRAAVLTDVTFEDCLLRDVDFGGAELVRVRFPGSRLTGADFSNTTVQQVDLRGAELGITAGYDSLRGAVIDSVQLVTLAPLLAAHLGIEVRDEA